MKRVLLSAMALWAITLLVGAGLVVGADFGLSTWVLIPALLWLATLGLPTTVGVVLVASVWGTVPGLNGLGAFLGCGAWVGLLFEMACCIGVSRWRSARPPADP